jgi:hypothetical protein
MNQPLLDMAHELFVEGPVNAVIVIDCKDKETMAFEHVKAFPETPEGNEKAEDLFREWVSEAAQSELAIEDVAGRKQFLSDRLEDGYYEVGDGYIAILHTT